MHGSAYLTLALNGTRGQPSISYSGASAASMFQVSSAGGLRTVITLLDGTRVEAVVFKQFMNLNVRLPGTYAGRTTGTFGW